MKMTKKKPKIKQSNDYQQFHLFVNQISENVHGTNFMHTAWNEKRRKKWLQTIMRKIVWNVISKRNTWKMGRGKYDKNNTLNVIVKPNILQIITFIYDSEIRTIALWIKCELLIFDVRHVYYVKNVNEKANFNEIRTRRKTFCTSAFAHLFDFSFRL